MTPERSTLERLPRDGQEREREQRVRLLVQNGEHEHGVVPQPPPLEEERRRQCEEQKLRSIVHIRAIHERDRQHEHRDARGEIYEGRSREARAEQEIPRRDADADEAAKEIDVRDVEMERAGIVPTRVLRRVSKAEYGRFLDEELPHAPRKPIRDDTTRGANKRR